MKRRVYVSMLIFFCVAFSLSAQTDKYGNPIFNSVVTGVNDFGGFTVTANYYTLENNIENKNSSVYIDDNPTLLQIETAAINLPSDFFLVTKEKKMLCIIGIMNYPEKQYTVISGDNSMKQYPCRLEGDIAQNRASEIIAMGYDSTAEIENGVLRFNNHDLTIIKNDDIFDSIMELIRTNGLAATDSSSNIIISQDELKKYVLEESKEGGKLDFFTPIKGKEYDGYQVKPGLYDTYGGMALYKWGKANYEVGIPTVEIAYEIFSELKGREITDKEKTYIKLGFNKELE